jgi:hypothetical protein
VSNAVEKYKDDCGKGCRYAYISSVRMHGHCNATMPCQFLSTDTSYSYEDELHKNAANNT